MQDIEQILSRAGIRPTSNRILVMRELIKSRRPMSMMDLESSIDTLDKSSVFRVLTTLLEQGLVHGIEDGRGITRYEICHGDHQRHKADDDLHAHFYCEKCNRVFCFPQINTPSVSMPEGFSVNSINFMIKGICPDCQSS